jgi:hypothetical protein
MKRYRVTNRQGVAIAVVLVFCTAILGFLTILLMNTRQQRGTFTMQYEQTRALMAARAAIQLAIYKYRVLPSEYYRINQMANDIKNGTGDPAAFDIARIMWLHDFQTEHIDTPAARIKMHLDSGVHGGPVGPDNPGSFAFGVEEFDLVSKTSHGYTKDYLRIKAWGSFKGTRKTLEELVEVKIAQ